MIGNLKVFIKFHKQIESLLKLDFSKGFHSSLSCIFGTVLISRHLMLYEHKKV